MASLNTGTGQYPEDDRRPPHIPQRAYVDRDVDAPKGSTLYWDMPSIVAAINLSRIRKNSFFEESANNYMKAFLNTCVAKNGIFLWGNHYYYHAFKDSVVKFIGRPSVVVNYNTEIGDLQETRPLIPAWDALWSISPESTLKHIRESSQNHIVDHQTGEFNRHSDQGASHHAFPEAGGALVYSLAWLYEKTGDSSLLKRADLIASYTFGTKGIKTGLIPISPANKRWDRITTTTEVGLWASCLVKSAEISNSKYSEKWIRMADEALSAWLKFGFDEKKKRYYGMINIENGSPHWRTDDYPYQPQNYTDIWHPFFPTHNYPMSLAEGCLTMYRITKKDIYRQAVDRWVSTIREELPARKGQGAYAEHYGRVIIFLMNCHQQLGDKHFKELATRVAEDAVGQLWAQGMFRSHPGEDRYDAVDGLGILALGLLWLDTDEKPDMLGLHF